jgi:hypothetical protein
MMLNRRLQPAVLPRDRGESCTADAGKRAPFNECGCDRIAVS